MEKYLSLLVSFALLLNIKPLRCVLEESGVWRFTPNTTKYYLTYTAYSDEKRCRPENERYKKGVRCCTQSNPGVSCSSFTVRLN